MAAARPDVRTACPLCGASVHPIAGRCKQCKADLGALRNGRSTAPAPLPALLPSTSPAPVPLALGASPIPDSPVVLPLPAPRAPRLVGVLVIGPALVGVAFLVVIVMRPSKPVERLPIDKKEIALEPLRPIPAPPPIDFGQVRAPVATDLATYTDQLARHGTLKATIYTRIGTIHCELFADKTPITVANFVGLATGKKPWTNPATHAIERGKRFYDGLTFHRAISGFMIQGGDPLGTGIGGPGYQFEDEVVPELKMQPGALAMANAGPGTNGSQFFITESAPSYLDGRHTIFGRCVDLDVVSKIAHADQNEQNKPTEDITMAITITR